MLEILEKIVNSRELWTLLYSAVPVTELRATIPLAITVWHLNPIKAMILAIIGNSLPILLVMFCLNKVVELSQKYSKVITKIIEAVFQRTRRKTWQKFEKYGLIALFLFVAVPLPMTGAWTGSVAAWLFGVPPRKAFWPIFGGVVVAAIIVTLLTVGVKILI